MIGRVTATEIVKDQRAASLGGIGPRVAWINHDHGASIPVASCIPASLSSVGIMSPWCWANMFRTIIWPGCTHGRVPCLCRARRVKEGMQELGRLDVGTVLLEKARPFCRGDDRSCQHPDLSGHRRRGQHPVAV